MSKFILTINRDGEVNNLGFRAKDTNDAKRIVTREVKGWLPHATKTFSYALYHLDEEDFRAGYTNPLVIEIQERLM